MSATVKVTIYCKVCAKEFEKEIPASFYDACIDAGVTEFAGTCPECRKDSPLLAMMDQMERLHG
jgi:hypothetical protein